MKNPKRMFYSEREKILPRKEIKDKIKERLNISTDSSVLRNTAEKKRRRVLIPAIAFSLAACLVICFFIPMLIKKPLPDPVGFPDKFDCVKNPQSFCTYGTISVGLLLASNAPEITASYNGNDDKVKTSDGNNSENKNIDDLNKYMLLVEGLLNEEAIETSEIFDKRGYSRAETVRFGVLYGDKVSYSVYYDQTPLRDDSSTEDNYSLQGVLSVGAVEYPMEGIYCVETKGDEVKTKMRFTAYTNDSKQSYIVMRYQTGAESDENETEYEYITFENGKEIEKLCVTYDADDDGRYVKIVLHKDGKNNLLKIREKVLDEAKSLDVIGSFGNSSANFVVNGETEKYTYEFSDGTSVVKPRFDSGANAENKDDD